MAAIPSITEEERLLNRDLERLDTPEARITGHNVTNYGSVEDGGAERRHPKRRRTRTRSKRRRASSAAAATRFVKQRQGDEDELTSYPTLLLRYTLLVPVFSLILIISLIYLKLRVWPYPPNNSEPPDYPPYQFPQLYPLVDVLTAAAAWSVSYSLRVPLLHLATLCGLCSTNIFSGIMAAFFNVFSQELLRLGVFMVLGVHLGAKQDHPDDMNTRVGGNIALHGDDLRLFDSQMRFSLPFSFPILSTYNPAFTRVYWIALSWASIDVLVGIIQGYGHLALYRDVLPPRKWGWSWQRQDTLENQGGRREYTQDPVYEDNMNEQGVAADGKSAAMDNTVASSTDQKGKRKSRSGTRTQTDGTLYGDSRPYEASSNAPSHPHPQPESHNIPQNNPQFSEPQPFPTISPSSSPSSSTRLVTQYDIQKSRSQQKVYSPNPPSQNVQLGPDGKTTSLDRKSSYRRTSGPLSSHPVTASYVNNPESHSDHHALLINNGRPDHFDFSSPIDISSSISLLLTHQHRTEIESVYGLQNGTPLFAIPLFSFVSALQRIDGVLLHVGFGLIVGAAWVGAWIEQPDTDSFGQNHHYPGSTPGSVPPKLLHTTVPIVAIVLAIHTFLTLLWTEALPRGWAGIGVHTVSYVGLLVGISVFLAGLGMWGCVS